MPVRFGKEDQRGRCQDLREVVHGDAAWQAMTPSWEPVLPNRDRWYSTEIFDFLARLRTHVGEDVLFLLRHPVLDWARPGSLAARCVSPKSANTRIPATTRRERNRAPDAP